MKALLVFLVAACAPTTAVSPAASVAGCWIQRTDTGGAITMRWLRDPQQPGALNGDLLVYAPDGAAHSARYRLEHRGSSWALCQHDAERCWQVTDRDEARGAPHALIEFSRNSYASPSSATAPTASCSKAPEMVAIDLDRGSSDPHTV